MPLPAIRKALISLSVLIPFTLLGGCATIMSGTTQSITFNSSPDGAEVNAGGRTLGKTPVTTMLKKESGQSVTFSKEGYKPVTMRLETHLDSWFWGNIVLGGLFGSSTDGITGAVNQYGPTQYMVTLAPTGTMKIEEKSSLSPNQQAKEFIIVSYKELIPELQRGQGSYVSSLLGLLKVKPENSAEATKKIRALSEAYTNIVEFANHVIELYTLPDTATPAIPPSAAPVVPAVKTKVYSGDAMDAVLEKFPKGDKIKIVLKDDRVVEGNFTSYADDKLWFNDGGIAKSLPMLKVKSIEVPLP